MRSVHQNVDMNSKVERIPRKQVYDALERAARGIASEKGVQASDLRGVAEGSRHAGCR